MKKKTRAEFVEELNDIKCKCIAYALAELGEPNNICYEAMQSALVKFIAEHAPEQ